MAKVKLNNMETLIYDKIEYEGYYIDKEGNIYSSFSDTIMKYYHQRGNTYFITIHNNLYNDGKNIQIFKNKALRDTFGDLYDVKNIAEDEKWKNVIINNEKSQYYISNYGRLYAVNQKIMKKYSVSNKGYARYRLYYGSEVTKNISVHKLVAEYFLKKPLDKNKNTINHIDGNKLNNYYKNLEYLTNAKNIKHSVEMNLRKGITDQTLQDMKKDRENGMTYKKIGLKYGFNPQNVSIKLKKLKLNS